MAHDIKQRLTLKGSVPQGSRLGPLLFIVLINDLKPGLLTWKFIDDTTIAESFRIPAQSEMQSCASNAVNWTQINHMQINAKKTKEIIFDFHRNALQLNPIQINNTVVETVSSVKLLGVYLMDTLEWKTQVEMTHKKASKRLFFLKRLKRSGFEADDLIYYYIAIIRSVMEYAAPVWHCGLTNEQSELLESIQKRALKIICPGIKYESALSAYNLPKLGERRDSLCRKLFQDITKSEENKLHYLLPKVQENKYNLRETKIYPLPACKTNRFKNSYINYCLFRYQ